MPPIQLPDIHKTIEKDRNDWGATPREILAYRRYAAGKHEFDLTQGQKDMLKGILGHDFCDNISNRILSTNADQLILCGYKCPNAEVQKFADSFWLLNTMADESSKSHYDTLRDSDYCISVAWDTEANRVILTREPWWDGNTGVFIGYDARGFMLYAVREWIDGENNKRRIVFYDGFFERYISTGGSGWFPYLLNGLPNTDVVITEREDGTSLDIPFIHFANSGRGTSNYGFSEIGGGVLGFNDQINDLHLDISATARQTGFQEKWFAGWAIEKDTTTNESKPIKSGPGVNHVSTNTDAKAGVLPAGDLSQQIAAYNLKISAVSRMTATPQHLITGGDWPSGEALWQSMKPLHDKAKSQQNRLGPAWILLLHRAIELANVYGGLGLDESPDTAPITVEWEDIEKRDPLTMAMSDGAFWDAANKALAAGVPIKIFLKRQGWTDTEILELVAAQEEERQKALQHQADSADIAMRYATDNPSNSTQNTQGNANPVYQQQ